MINPFVEQRKRMKLLLLKMLEENKEMPRKKVLALFSLKTGISIKTAKRYLEELEEVVIDEEEEERTYNKQKTLIEQRKNK